MSNPFQQRWGFRRNDSDLDSSSDEHSRPSSVGEPNVKKPKVATRLFLDQNDQQTMHSPHSHLEGENHTSFEETDGEPNNSSKKQERKPRVRRTARKPSYQEPSDGALNELKAYMESLVEGLTVARDNLLKWMNKEMEKPFKGDMNSSKPSVTRKGQSRGNKETQNTNRSITPRKNSNNVRKKSGTIPQNRQYESLEKLVKEKKTSDETTEEVVPPKEPEIINIDTPPSEKNVKQKGKGLSASTRKRKVAAGDQQTEKAAADASAASGSCLTLPTVPQQQVGNSDRNQSEDGDESHVGNRNALDSSINLSSQLNFIPRSQQKDGVFCQNGVRNVNEYEQVRVPLTRNVRGNGNGIGNGFAFALSSQGLNAGNGMPNISSQFGLQYLTHTENRLPGLRMNGGPSGFPSASHAFMESYGSFNQQLSFNAQQGGVMSLHSSNSIGPGNMQPR